MQKRSSDETNTEGESSKTPQNSTSIVWLLKVNKIVQDVSLLLVFFFFQHSQDICLNPTKSEVNFNSMKTTQKTNKQKKWKKENK